MLFVELPLRDEGKRSATEIQISEEDYAMTTTHTIIRNLSRVTVIRSLLVLFIPVATLSINLNSMTRLKRAILGAVAVTVICLVTAAQTNADPLVLTIDNPNQTVTPGTWITFAGTLTNFTPLAFHIGGPGISYPDGLVNIGDIDTPSNFLTDPGPMSTVSGGVLNVRISPTAAPGTYTATLFVVGFLADGSVALPPCQVNVTVTDPSAVPELPSMVLFGTGLIGAAGLARRYQKRSLRSVTFRKA